jgi:hypothetical protein
MNKKAMTPEEARKYHRGVSQRLSEQKILKEKRRKARITAKQQKQIANDQDRIRARWAKSLIKEGWKETESGWRLGNRDPLPIDQALVDMRAAKRDEKAGYDDRLAAWLTECGWQRTGPDNDTWMIKNWEKPDGYCYRTLRQAAKIQMKLTPDLVDDGSTLED